MMLWVGLEAPASFLADVFDNKLLDLNYNQPVWLFVMCLKRIAVLIFNLVVCDP